MLKVGDRVMHYVDDIEKYRLSEIREVYANNRYLLKKVDSDKHLIRILDNNLNHQIFNYEKVSE